MFKCHLLFSHGINNKRPSELLSQILRSYLLLTPLLAHKTFRRRLLSNRIIQIQIKNEIKVKNCVFSPKCVDFVRTIKRQNYNFIWHSKSHTDNSVVYWTINTNETIALQGRKNSEIFEIHLRWHDDDLQIALSLIQFESKVNQVSERLISGKIVNELIQ